MSIVQVHHMIKLIWLENSENCYKYIFDVEVEKLLICFSVRNETPMICSQINDIKINTRKKFNCRHNISFSMVVK